MTAVGRMPTHRGAWIATLLLFAVIAWQLLGLVQQAATRNLAFDGGMNLEVSKSIANGLGPRARYHDARLYPAGVQSKEPFVLVGAAVFKVAGVGPMQAQTANLIYLFALAALIVCVVARVSDLATGALAAIFVLAMPRLYFYGLNGYGEIATMCFGLAALGIVAWPERLRPFGFWRPFLAGVFAALAVATKVVGLVQLAAIAAVLAMRVAVDADPRQRFQALLRGGLAFTAGVALPLLLIEAWRWHWLDTAGYKAYWNFQLTAIQAQSGATPRDAQAGMLQKIPVHFGVLMQEFRRSGLATAALLVVPLIAIGMTVRGVSSRASTKSDAPRRWLIAGLVLIACAYLPWWLAIVPTNKAWVRYLYIALLALALLSAMASMTSARIAAFGRDRNIAVRGVHGVLAIAVLSLYAPFVVRSLPKSLDFTPSVELQAVEYAANVISSLPEDRQVFGYGWYASPVIQLYSDRPFMDLTDWPVGLLLRDPAYIVLDRAALAVGMVDRVLQRYPHRRLMRTNPHAQVYEVDFAHPRDPFAGMDTSKSLSRVDFSITAYPLVYAYEPYDPMGGRFNETDSEVLLRYEGKPVLTFSAYAGLTSYYLRTQPVRGRVIVGDCPSRPFAFDRNGRWQTFRIALSCKPAPGENVRVRLLLDNAFNLPQLYDRQRGILVRDIGFVD